MNRSFQYNLIAASIAALVLSGCGDAETTIIEKDPIAVSDDHDNDSHDHGDEYTIESMGRLAVLSAQSNDANLYDLDDGDLLDSFTLIHDENAITASSGYRYAVIASRSNNYVGFIDSGLWREDHVEHLHDFKQAPIMSDYELNNSRPTHIVKHDGKMVIFYDGDANTGVSSFVEVLTDTDISAKTSKLPHIEYSINMHGVAKPQGDILLSTVRREEDQSTSAAKILPDQVGVYHLHGTEYEQEQILSTPCPDLHGAAQNNNYIIFGCSDGVLITHQHDDKYEAEKVLNINGLNGLSIGTIYGHEDSNSFIGIASAHGGGSAILVNINPDEEEMEKLEWQLDEGASPVSYAFSHEGEHFLVLDNQGYLNILSPHDHAGETHWEFEQRIDISEEDVSTMPEGMSFSMTVAQNGHYVYVSDPIAKHVLQIDLETVSIKSDIEVNFSPKSIVWLGIAEESHEH